MAADTPRRLVITPEQKSQGYLRLRRAEPEAFLGFVERCAFDVIGRDRFGNYVAIDPAWKEEASRGR